MKQAIIYEKIAKNIDADYYVNNPEDTVHIEIIKGYIHDFSRNKDVQLKIKETVALLTDNEDTKIQLLQKLDSQQIPEILDEYKSKNTQLSIEDKESNRNLYHFKKYLELELLKEHNPGKKF